MSGRETNLDRVDHAWFALVDAEHCRLLCCNVPAQGTQRVEEKGVLENTFPEREHQRPQTGDGMTHDVEEKERRFAGMIVEWLEKRAGEHKIKHMVILAPPRMLGVLRRIPLGPLKGNLEELQGDLMRLRVGQLAEHPLVRKLVQITQQAG